MRLVDGNAIVKCFDPNTWQGEMMIAIANGLPTIDAVPVVRCKECEDYNTTGCLKGFGWCENMDRGVIGDFYCANGAKMESEGNQ
jgi:hypothetical protein